MNSIRANFFKWMLRSTNNINPITHPNAIENMRNMAEKYINNKVPKGHTLQFSETENGTKYQVMS